MEDRCTRDGRTIELTSLSGHPAWIVYEDPDDPWGTLRDHGFECLRVDACIVLEYYLINGRLP